MITDIIVFTTTLGPWVLGGVILGGLAGAFIPKQTIKPREGRTQ